MIVSHEKESPPFQPSCGGGRGYRPWWLVFLTIIAYALSATMNPLGGGDCRVFLVGAVRASLNVSDELEGPAKDLARKGTSCKAVRRALFPRFF